MGRSTRNNFEQRFGNPPRIQIIPVTDRDSGSAEARYQKERIFEAYVGLLKDLLGRQPNDAEIFGMESIEDKAKIIDKEQILNEVHN